MSYDTDLIKAKEGWWADIREKGITDDVPDPIQPHPFADAVQKMDKLLADSWCYKSEGLFNIDKARKKFYDITNSDDITQFLKYLAALLLKVKKDSAGAIKGATWGLCLLGVKGNVPTVKRYVAAYLSKNLNLEYSLVVLAIEGVHKKYTAGEDTNLFKDLYDTIQPDSTEWVRDWKKGAQLAVMSLAHAYPGTEVESKSWVNFMAAIKHQRAPQYCLLEGEVEPPEPPQPKGGSQFPWLIVILVLLSVYGLYYYNINS